MTTSATTATISNQSISFLFLVLIKVSHLQGIKNYPLYVIPYRFTALAHCVEKLLQNSEIQRKKGLFGTFCLP